MTTENMISVVNEVVVDKRSDGITAGNQKIQPVGISSFPLNRWWVAGFSKELDDKPIARTILNLPMVLFRLPNSTVAALSDRCCHKDLPLSCGTVEDAGLRCGYHGLLYNGSGKCIEIPGQERIPEKARVNSYPLRERDGILWVWVGSSVDVDPMDEPPAYPLHRDPRFKFGSGHFHYNAPYQLIHDNLLDLSHVGYVHQKTIGGNPTQHMTASFKTSVVGDVVVVNRPMPNTLAPPTYTAIWPFEGRVDRWQEVEFHVSHLLIWAGAGEVGQYALDDPNRGGMHIRGFHGVTPETETSSHYFWSIGTNEHAERPDGARLLLEQTIDTFNEDKFVIEEQWRNQRRFPDHAQVDIHIDVGPIRARRIIESLRRQNG
jgi:vanillate O-demethylase monooxygenase subunit